MDIHILCYAPDVIGHCIWDSFSYLIISGKPSFCARRIPFPPGYSSIKSLDIAF